MIRIFKEKSPQERIRNADKSTQRLRDKRSKLNPKSDKEKINKINGKIHRNNVETDIAFAELKQPKKETRTTNISFNKNDKSKQVHFHGHYHAKSK